MAAMPLPHGIDIIGTDRPAYLESLKLPARSSDNFNVFVRKRRPIPEPVRVVVKGNFKPKVLLHDRVGRRYTYPCVGSHRDDAYNKSMIYSCWRKSNINFADNEKTSQLEASIDEKNCTPLPRQRRSCAHSSASFSHWPYNRNSTGGGKKAETEVPHKQFQDEENVNKQSIPTTSVESEQHRNQQMKREIKSLQKQLIEMEEKRSCKICLSDPANTLFLPCGHMCCCTKCTELTTICPICFMKKVKAVKVYLP